MDLTTKVCIIGAGISGLTAARTLLKNNHLDPSDVVIVEAQNRVGGRIYTQSQKSIYGAPYDFGAAWFHDVQTNSLLQDLIDEGLFNIFKDGYFDDKDVSYHADEIYGKLDVSSYKLNRVIEDMEKFIELTYHNPSTDDISLMEITEAYLSKFKSHLTEEQKKYCGRMIRYKELWYGISLENISAKYCVMAHAGRNLYNKKGFEFVIKHLLSELQCQILLDSKVTMIERDIHNFQRSHTITTANSIKIHADYVVVSAPLSILKLPPGHSYGIEWLPPLPNNLVLFLQSIHFGALGKVILEFRSIWWDSTEDKFEVIPNDYVNLQIPLPFQYPICVVNYSKIQPGIPSLVVLIQSPVTEYLEINPGLAWKYLKPMLEKIKVKPIQDPFNVLVTDWTQNSFSQGSYTAVHVGDSPTESVNLLAGDVFGKHSTIRFAGEHTIDRGSGCVHGAYDSGRRAGNWILRDME